MKRPWFFFLLLVSFVTFAATNARASSFTLNFGGLQNGEQVLNYYDGGLGSLGSGPGTNYGVTFTPGFSAVTGIPPYGPNEVGFLSSSSAMMNVSGGITNAFSFYYEGSGSVTAWSGLNGTGIMLVDILLPTATGWTADGSPLAVGGMSVVFSGAGAQFDEITDVGYVLPEPPNWLLVGTGMASLAAWLRCRTSYQQSED